MDLYDTAADVVRKAIIGGETSPSEVASAAGLGTKDVMAFLGGDGAEPVGRRIAAVLGLDADALAALPQYGPPPELPPEISQIPLPFEDDEVNVWRISHGEERLVIDCGFEPSDFRRAMARSAYHLLVTHPHRDHIGGLRTELPGLVSAHGPSGTPRVEQLAAGDSITIGSFEIRVFDLAGHHPAAIGYFIRTPGFRVAAVGDAIFAGSIGGCPDAASFRRARETIEAAFTDVEPDLPILTGHGPATTIGRERTANPFLAAWSV